MFTVKCYHHEANLHHAYETSLYTVQELPLVYYDGSEPRSNGEKRFTKGTHQGYLITFTEASGSSLSLWANEANYDDIFVENSSGKTIERLSGKICSSNKIDGVMSSEVFREKYRV